MKTKWLARMAEQSDLPKFKYYTAYLEKMQMQMRRNEIREGKCPTWLCNVLAQGFDASSWLEKCDATQYVLQLSLVL